MRINAFGRVYNYLRPFSFVNVVFHVFLVVLVILIVFFVSSVLVSEENKNIAAYVAIVASTLALTTLTYNARRHISEDYSKDAKEYLKRAYEILAPSTPDAFPPDTRMAWLTAARNIKIAERLGSQVIMSSHKESFVEEKQFWRLKLGEIIKNFPPKYYAEPPEKFIVCGPDDKEPLSEYSLYVVHKFIDWDDEYKEPLDTTRFSQQDKERLLRRGYSNLYYLLTAVDKLRLRR